MTSLRFPKANLHPGFEFVAISRDEYLQPADPDNYGERVLWNDGSVHGWPEDDSDPVIVLRRILPGGPDA